jgi:hypothetical protein
MDVEKAASAAATGCMQEAQEVGQAAVAAVADSVSGPIEGVEVVLAKPFARWKEPA